jgi:elongation factor G
VLLRYHIKKRLLGSVDHREVYKKQSGGRGKFADIQSSNFGPVDADWDRKRRFATFVNDIVGGAYST